MDTRAFHNIITIGTIAKLSVDGMFAQVKIGDITTKPLPLPALYSQNFKAWLPMHETAQVVLNCPSGNLENAVIIALLWPAGETPHTTDRAIDGIKFNDGTILSYNSETQTLSIDSVGTINIHADGDINIETAGTFKLKASAIEIDGAITQINGDITSDGISVQTHKHIETGTKTQVPE